MSFEGNLFSQPPSGNFTTKIFNQKQQGYDLAKEFEKYKPPKGQNTPPTKPPPKNYKKKAGGLLKSYGTNLGIDLSKKYLNYFFGQSPNIVGPAQEQQAIDNAQPPGQDKQIQPPPPFQGGQIDYGHYSIDWEIGYSNGSIEQYTSGPHLGKIKDYKIDAHSSSNALFLHCQDQFYYHYVLVRHGGGLPLTYAHIKKITRLYSNDPDASYPPGSISPGNTPGLGPLTLGLTAPPGILSPPGVKAPPGTKDDKDKDKKKFPFPFFNPGTNTSPGTNTNPGFDPFGNLAPSPFPNPLTNPGTNTTPGTSPGTNTTPGTSSKSKENDNLFPPLFLPPGLAPVSGALTGFAPAIQPTGPSVNTQPSGCQTSCSAPVMGKLNDQDKKFDDLGNKLDVINAGANAGQLAQLNEVLARLGPKLDGGLSTFMKGKFEKLWESKALDRALSLMNLAASVHNAVMLSRNIGATLGLAVTNVMALIGIKDPEGKTSAFSELVGNTVESVIKGIIGAENYTELTTTWKRANRIYQAAINTYQLLTDSLFAVAEGLELIGKYTGKVGNALKKSGAVLDSSYSWFNETFDFHSKKNGTMAKVIEGLQAGQEIASDLAEITEEFREASENITEIGNQVNLIKGELKKETDAKTVSETTSKTNSLTPDIPKSAMIQPSPPPPET